MIGRLLRFFFLLRHSGIDCEPFVQPQTKRTIREIAKISAWVLLGAAAATLFWYLMMLFSNIFPILIEIKYKGRLKTLIQRFQTAFDVQT